MIAPAYCVSYVTEGPVQKDPFHLKYPTDTTQVSNFEVHTIYNALKYSTRKIIELIQELIRSYHNLE